MNKCSWIARVCLITIGIALVMVMLIRLFETASANPIVPYPDTFEFVWPSDVTQPEQLQLQCHDASGNIEYTNTIDRVSSKYFVGGQDIGDSFGLTNNITQCDLLFNINGIDRVVHYVNPQPVNCTKKEQEGVVRTLLITCAWRFDLSDTSIWNGATVTGSPPTTAPTSSHTATPPLKMTGLPPTETFTGAPNTTSAFVESESRQTNPGILQDWVRFLIGLLLAWLVEIPVLLIMTRILFSPKEISLRRVILLGFLVTLVTLPILWFVLPLFLSGVPYMLIGESLVVLIEAGILKFGLKISFAKALLMSLAANAASFIAGLLLL